MSADRPTREKWIGDSFLKLTAVNRHASPPRADRLVAVPARYEDDHIAEFRLFSDQGVQYTLVVNESNQEGVIWIHGWPRRNGRTVRALLAAYALRHGEQE